jgi:hypothetical protein
MQTNNPDELTVKYLTLKTSIISTKLNQTYKNILIRASDDIPDQIVFKLDNWGNTHVYVNNGVKNEESVYIVYSDNDKLGYYGILSENLNNQLEQILTIINFINGKIIL